MPFATFSVLQNELTKQYYETLKMKVFAYGCAGNAPSSWANNFPISVFGRA